MGRLGPTLDFQSSLRCQHASHPDMCIFSAPGTPGTEIAWLSSLVHQARLFFGDDNTDVAMVTPSRN